MIVLKKIGAKLFDVSVRLTVASDISKWVSLYVTCYYHIKLSARIPKSYIMNDDEKYLEITWRSCTIIPSVLCDLCIEWLQALF